MKTETMIKPYLQLGSFLILFFYFMPSHAADLKLESTSPYILFDDTDETGFEWNINGTESVFKLIIK